jgi:uncharacterized protein (TIGR03437 family)
LLAAAFFPSELYDPLTGVFAITGAGAGPGPSTSLGNGNVLTTGGWNDDPGPSARAELYDASTGAFTTTGTMNALRANHTATLLPDGNVLISGGSSGISLTTTSGTGMSFYCCVASAELYDSNSGVFAEIPSMSTARGGHTATLLNSGDVLIAGGGMATAEVYHPELPIAAPDLFTLSSDGQCQGAIWHANSGALASATNPAVAGEILSMYTNNLIDGGLIPPQVVVGGWLAEIPYFGPAPGYRGYYQVNFRVPIGVSPGSAVPVRLNYLNRTSNEVSISVQ